MEVEETEKAEVVQSDKPAEKTETESSEQQPSKKVKKEEEKMDEDAKPGKKGKVEGKPHWWRDVSTMNENQKKKYFRTLAIRKFKKVRSRKCPINYC